MSIQPCCMCSLLSYLFTLAVCIYSDHIYSASLCTFTRVISVQHCCIHSFLSCLFSLADHIHLCHVSSPLAVYIHVCIVFVYIHSRHVCSALLYTFIIIISLHPWFMHSLLSHLLALAVHIHSYHIFSPLLYTFIPIVSIHPCCIHSYEVYSPMLHTFIVIMSFHPCCTHSFLSYLFSLAVHIQSYYIY